MYSLLSVKMNGKMEINVAYVTSYMKPYSLEHLQQG